MMWKSAMTAQESLLRYTIRGKSLSGLLMQQKNEMLVPMIDRSIQISFELGILGTNPLEDPKGAEKLKELHPDRVIPNVILELIKEGKSWFDIQEVWQWLL